MSQPADNTWLDPIRWADALRLSRQEVAAFPNRLTCPTPDRSGIAPAWLALVLLLAAALLPRAVMARRIPTICTDGTIYVSLAVQRDGGRFDPGEVHINNLYPRILSVLHSTGLSWETAGKTWGVLCGALVVLPLFGWVRRQFNDRTAVVACLIYIAHPEFIEWSPELVRDQTFWLLFATSLYCIWRAVVEVSVPFHLAAAVTAPLCVLTRFEGLFLIIPYVGWTAVRLYHLQSGRRGFVVSWAAVLLLGGVGLAASGKSESVAANLSLRRPWQRAQAWWSGSSTTAEAPASVTQPVASPLTLSISAKLFVRVVARGLTEITGTLILLGLLLFPRIFFRSDQLPMLLLSLAICGGIWIHLWYSGGEASSRYSLAIVLMGTRCAAVCLMRLIDGTAELAENRSSPLRTAAMLAPLGILTVVGMIDALGTNYDGRLAKAELGRWIERTYGQNSRLAGEGGQLPIVGFYARTGHTLLSTAGDVEGWIEQIRTAVPDIVLLPRHYFPGAAYQNFFDRMKVLGLERTEPDLPIPLQDDTTVWSRTPIRR